MTDLRKLSEAASPGEWVFQFVENQCDEGKTEYEVTAEHGALMWDAPYYPEALCAEDAQFVCTLVNYFRSGSLIPRSEYERVLALLAEAREALAQYQRDLCEGFCRDLPTREYFEEDMAIDCAACRHRATLSRIDDALAAEPEARG